MDDDTDTDKEDTKRILRNLNEKKRRDQFNLVVNELSAIISPHNPKINKSTVLKSTISLFKQYNDVADRSRVYEIDETWKPSFLSNKEFSYLILEAFDGFMISFTSCGQICYVSETITSLLGYLPCEIINMNIYDLTYEEDHSALFNLLSNPPIIFSVMDKEVPRENQVSFSCHLKCGGAKYKQKYELVQFVGYFRNSSEVKEPYSEAKSNKYANESSQKIIFVGTCKIQTPQFFKEFSVIDSAKNEFTSHHTLEWKFLFLDQRAPMIIGYSLFDVLGTCCYDYYHFDDLDKVVSSHETLMQKGKATSSYYRFLTKGQQYIWLQSRYYIVYHQWIWKPDFVVCTHRLVNYADVWKQMRNNDENKNDDQSSSNSNNNEDGREMSSLDDSLSNTPDNQLSSAASKVDTSPRSPISSLITKFASCTNPSSPASDVRHHQPSYYEERAALPSNKHSSSSSTHNKSVQRSSRQNVNQTSTASTSRSMTQNNEVFQQQADQHQYYQPYQLAALAPNSHLAHPEIQLHQLAIPHITAPAFNEGSQYMTESMQPVLSAEYSSATAIISPIQSISEITSPGIVMTTSQTHIQDELQRKHEELQQIISRQQEELRLVSEQLQMARCGLMPPIPTMIDAAAPFTTENRSEQMCPQTNFGASSSSSRNNQLIEMENTGDSYSVGHCNFMGNQYNNTGVGNEVVSYIELTASTTPVTNLHHQQSYSESQPFSSQQHSIHSLAQFPLHQQYQHDNVQMRDMSNFGYHYRTENIVTEENQMLLSDVTDDPNLMAYSETAEMP